MHRRAPFGGVDGVALEQAVPEQIERRRTGVAEQGGQGFVIDGGFGEIERQIVQAGRKALGPRRVGGEQRADITRRRPLRQCRHAPPGSGQLRTIGKGCFWWHWLLRQIDLGRKTLHRIVTVTPSRAKPQERQTDNDNT